MSDEKPKHEETAEYWKSMFEDQLRRKRKAQEIFDNRIDDLGKILQVTRDNRDASAKMLAKQRDLAREAEIERDAFRSALKSIKEKIDEIFSAKTAGEEK